MSENPYASPEPGGVLQAQMVGPETAAAPQGLGAFVIAVLIIDMLICAGRLLLVPLGITGYLELAESEPLREVAIFEVATNAGVGLFGILAAVLILLKKRLGIPLAVVTIVFTGGNMLVGIWEGVLQVPAEAPPALFVGFMTGIVMVMVIRAGILGIYIAAIAIARNRLARLANVRRDR